MLQGEHSAILLTFSKPHLSLRSLFCLFWSGHFTQVLLYTILVDLEKSSCIGQAHLKWSCYSIKELSVKKA